MANRSKMDPNQITQHTYEEELEAIRVHVLPTQLEMSITAESGDSILAVPKMQVIRCLAGQVVDTTQFKKAVAIPDTAVSIVVLDQELPHGNLTVVPQDICVPALKVATDCILILQS
jgi:hypothetical protein